MAYGLGNTTGYCLAGMQECKGVTLNIISIVTTPLDRHLDLLSSTTAAGSSLLRVETNVPMFCLLIFML